MVVNRRPRSSAAAASPNGSDWVDLGIQGRPRRKRPSSGGGLCSFLPRSLIGTLVVLGGGCTFAFLSGMASSRGRIRRPAQAEAGPSSSMAAAPARALGAARTRDAPLDPVGLGSPATNATIHVIFSTDCGSFQHWQSYLFFHSALKVKQPGYVTRIASGCTDEQLAEEKAWHEEHIQSKMSDRFRIHFTPHFSGVKDEEGNVKGDYKFFNKPFGLKHFLEENELLGLDASGKQMKHPDDVIILTDPDFLLLRPLTDDFSSARETLVGPRRKKIYQEKEPKIVTHGNPFAQTYGLGAQWRKFDLDAIAGADSPAKEVDQPTAGIYYPAGPPYVVTAKDMYDIAVTWSEFAPRVHAQYPHLLAEMYAYCIAAAHLKLPHMLIDSMMVSSAGIGGEGWKLVKDIPAPEVCSFASNPDHAVHPVPSVIHFCQRYHVDKFFFSKRKVPHQIFTCEHPLLVEPPMDLGSGKYLSVVPQGKTEKERKEITAEKEQNEAFMVCALTRATNDAMAFFKKNHCEGEVDTGKRYDMWAGKEVVA